jgi:hypothetical protein
MCCAKAAAERKARSTACSWTGHEVRPPQCAAEAGNVEYKILCTSAATPALVRPTWDRPSRGVGQARVKLPRSHAAIFIRSVDVTGRQIRGPGRAAGYGLECGESFYGTMGGPWWYHTATSVLRVRNPPFSLLRMLIQATPNRRQKSEKGIRPPKPPPCDINATSKPPQCVLLARR